MSKSQSPSNVNEDIEAAHLIFEERMNCHSESDSLVLQGPMTVEEIRAKIKEYQSQIREEKP